MGNFYGESGRSGTGLNLQKIDNNKPPLLVFRSGGLSVSGIGLLRSAQALPVPPALDWQNNLISNQPTILGNQKLDDRKLGDKKAINRTWDQCGQIGSMIRPLTYEPACDRQWPRHGLAQG